MKKEEKLEARAIRVAEQVKKLDDELKAAGYHGLHIRLAREAMPVLRDILEEANLARLEQGR